MSAIGYISAFDGLTLVNGTTPAATLAAINHVDDTAVVINRFVTLPNGTVLNLDGTEDADTSPGKATQIIRSSQSAFIFYNSVKSKKGVRGTITKTLLLFGSQTCTGVLMDVRIVEPFTSAEDRVELELDFQFETEWV